ncbi:response regulator [bacterium]|jgi:DNA-binding response OmpR family regulator|nr:response regulator [bacterium]
MKAKILVVDDDPDLTNLVRSILEAEDYMVYSAESGEEALGEVPKLRPDLIILDIILPGIDGYNICKILKTDDHTSPIPIIILSIRSSVEDRIMGLNIGADDYITKPFDPGELAARVEAVLRGYGHSRLSGDERS